MFVLSAVMIIVLIIFITITNDECWLLRLLFGIVLVLNVFGLCANIPVADGQKTDKELRVLIRSCEKDLPRNLHCKIEIVKP